MINISEKQLINLLNNLSIVDNKSHNYTRKVLLDLSNSNYVYDLLFKIYSDNSLYYYYTKNEEHNSNAILIENFIKIKYYAINILNYYLDISNIIIDTKVNKNNFFKDLNKKVIDLIENFLSNEYYTNSSNLISTKFDLVDYLHYKTPLSNSLSKLFFNIMYISNEKKLNEINLLFDIFYKFLCDSNYMIKEDSFILNFIIYFLEENEELFIYYSKINNNIINLFVRSLIKSLKKILCIEISSAVTDKNLSYNSKNDYMCKNIETNICNEKEKVFVHSYVSCKDTSSNKEYISDFDLITNNTGSKIKKVNIIKPKNLCKYILCLKYIVKNVILDNAIISLIYQINKCILYTLSYSNNEEEISINVLDMNNYLNNRKDIDKVSKININSEFYCTNSFSNCNYYGNDYTYTSNKNNFNEIKTLSSINTGELSNTDTTAKDNNLSTKNKILNNRRNFININFKLESLNNLCLELNLIVLKNNSEIFVNDIEFLTNKIYFNRFLFSNYYTNLIILESITLFYEYYYNLNKKLYEQQESLKNIHYETNNSSLFSGHYSNMSTKISNCKIKLEEYQINKNLLSITTKHIINLASK